MVITALVTPYKHNGKVNLNKLKELLLFQEVSHIDTVILFGSTGEGNLLSLKEKIKITSFSKRVSNLKIILNIGLNNLNETLGNIKIFSRYKPYAFLITTPYYLNLNEDEIYSYYETLNNYSKIPLIIYNVPSRTNVDLSLNLINRLSKLDNIIGIKEASKNLYKLQNIKDNVSKSFLFFLGNDEMILENINFDGIMSTLSNIIPKAFINKDLEKIKFYLRFTHLGNNPNVIKSLMNIKGFDVGKVRLPLKGLDVEKENRIKEILGGKI